MSDREVMENILLTTKGVCDLYMHGSIESATPKVRQAFTAALNDSLSMQGCVYERMANNGWFPSEQADTQKINQVRQKYCCG